MAMITEQQPLKYCLDSLSTDTTGIIITRSGNEIDLTGITDIKGFEVTYSQPSGTTIRFLFRTSDNANWFKLSTSGTRINVTSLTPDYETAAASGNTVSELRSLSSVSAFAGKKVLTAIALGSTDIVNAVPRVKLKLKALNSSQKLTYTELSPVYDTGKSGQISQVSYEPTITGNASVKVSAKITDTSGNESSWQELSKVSGQKAQNIQLRAEYSVPSLNSGSAKINSAKIVYTDGISITSGSVTSEIISETYDWYMNVKHCRLSVRHSELEDAGIEAYVSFRKRPVLIQDETLGIGTGKSVTYQLKYPTGVKYDTVRLYFDNVRVFGGFDINGKVGRITCTAPSGTLITCDYEYGWTKEEWQKMSVNSREALEDYDITEFRYSRPDDAYKSVVAVKIALTSKTGSVTKESVGKGTGKAQTYRLNHTVKDGAITVYDNNTAMSAKNYSLLDDPQYISVACSNGHTITASYDWVSEKAYVYQLAAVFSE